MTTRAHQGRWALLVAAWMATACDGGPALDLELVPDPNLPSEADLVRLLDRIDLVVDHPDGLYPADYDTTEFPGGRLVNLDADPALELNASSPVVDHLPLIRLERGGLVHNVVDIRVRGLDATGATIAEGRARTAAFTDGVEPLPIPFNMLSELLPPRVVEVIPGDGARITDCQVPTIIVIFSKPVDLTSFFALQSVTVDGMEPVDKRLDVSGIVAQITPPTVTGDEITLQYRLEVGTSITDVDGNALDQAPSVPGPQPYIGDFSFPCVAATGFPDPEACSETAPEGTCPSSPRFGCDAGACVLASCEGAACEPGFVCDPVTFRCEDDCRPTGVCADGTVCGPMTGTCGGL